MGVPQVLTGSVTQFFSRDGSTMDNTGLGTDGNIHVYQEAFKYPESRAYTWNISNERVGLSLLGNVYRDGLNVATKFFAGLSDYTFLDEPILGGPSNESVAAGKSLNIELAYQWKGGIGRVLVYNRKLKDQERAAVLNLLNNQELRVQTVTPSQIPDYSDTQQIHLNKNKESIRNKPIDHNGFMGFVTFDS